MRTGALAFVVFVAAFAGAACADAPPAPVAAATTPATPAEAPARIVVAFANPAHSAPAPAGSTGNRYSGFGYSVSQSAEQQARRVAQVYALRAVASWPIEALAMHCVVFEITNGRPMADVLGALAKDSRVLLAQPLQQFHTLTDASAPAVSYNDPLYDLQTNLTTLGIARAHKRTQGAGLKVALIDTAVDAGHPDLRGRIVRSHSFVPEHAAAGSLRHGTAMAGLIAAVANNHIGIVGIAPLAQVEVFEACWQLQPDNDAAACNTFTLAQALAAALASGAPLVNLSIAGPSDPLLAALVEQGMKRGITFVGAVPAGPAGFPTSIPGVIAAGGSEHALPAGALAAPSQRVMTLRPAGQYDFESGSSVAAAEVTGVIALLMSAAPARLAPQAILALLHESTPTAVRSSEDPAPVDVNAALARLDAQNLRSSIAARDAP
jgi:subtilisin family serine protease